jgi:cysteine desulfurase
MATVRRMTATASVRLVSVMLGNNETGVVQPIAELADVCAAAGALLHTDAVQAVGKVPVDFRALGVDALSCSAHKFHGPPGIGVLIVRRGIRLEPLMRGGFQQGGLRAGTEPVALAVGMATALRLWHGESAARQVHLQTLRDRLEAGLRENWPELVVHGGGAARLPQTSSMAFPGLNRQALLMGLDLAGIACSSGSACASGSTEPSHVLLAMGCSKGVVESSVRWSVGWTTTAQEVEEAVRRINMVCNRLRHQDAGRKSASPPPSRAANAI